MPTYASPVAVTDLQMYLKDTSTDVNLLLFFQSLLDTTTEFVYAWLDRDFTPSASKTDVFMGNDTNEHRLHCAAASIVSWQYRDMLGVSTSVATSEMLLFDSGLLVRLKTMIFGCDYEHTITYLQPASITCPESVRQVILERAAVIFQESNQGEGILGEEMSYLRDQSNLERAAYIDLTPAHLEILRNYKRYPV